MITTKSSHIVNDSAVSGVTVKEALDVLAASIGGLSPTDRAKFDSIAYGATANSTDAALRARASHTGTQAASTISDLAAVARAIVAAQLVPGTNVSITPSGDTLIIAATQGPVGPIGPPGSVIDQVMSLPKAITHNETIPANSEAFFAAGVINPGFTLTVGLGSTLRHMVGTGL